MKNYFDEMFDFDKAIPLEEFLEELKGMAKAFANDNDVEKADLFDEQDTNSE